MNPENASFQDLIIHYVGSKNNLDPLFISNDVIRLTAENNKLLQENLLLRFRNIPEYYSFHHPSSLDFNEVFQYCKTIFEDRDQLLPASASMARHLYGQSTHPKVKGGELYVAYFEGLAVESRLYKAIGIFKTENKSIFLDVHQGNSNMELALREGVEAGRMDKGCLVMNRNEDKGFDVLIFDSQNRGEEAQYWKDKFLSLQPQQTEFHHTTHFMNLTKQFITGELEAEHQVTKTEQVELLHKTLDYFKTNEAFDIEEFQNEVFGKDEMIESFRRFGSRYVENTDYDLASQFDISADAVRKGSRVYKSVLKLDRNFHIYIHGRTDLIEKGVDLDGRKYYKIYYQEEN